MNAFASSHPWRTLLLLGLAASSAAAQSLMSQNHEVVMAVGDPVPGMPGVTIQAQSNFDPPQIDQNGTVVFRGRLVGGTVSAVDDRAYFLGRGKGDLQMILQAGTQAPGLPAGILLRNSTSSAGLNGFPRISPFGEILFFQSALYDPVNPATTPTTADTALFWGSAGAFLPLAREGDQVPFLTAGLTWGSLAAGLQNTQINASGFVVFPASVVGATTADDGLLVTGLPGSLSLVSREGDVMPDGSVVAAITGTSLTNVTQMNAAGQVLHEMRFLTTSPSTATTANDRALAIWTTGIDTIIAREGDQAPGLPAGVTFGNATATWSPSVGTSAFTSSGKTAFVATVIGGPVTPSTDQVVYCGGIGGLTLIAQKGNPAPGLTGGETFGTTNTSSLTCNDDGEVAFINNLLGATTSTDSSMWLGGAGNLKMIAREGDVVSVLMPSVNGPWRFSGIIGGSNNPLLNGRGDVLFQCDVTDGVATKTVHLAWMRGFGLRLVLDNTDTFTTSAGPSTWTTLVTNAGFNGGDGGQSHFNNSGDFVVKAGLTTGTAAIVRGHVGSLQAGPASIATLPGGTQTFSIDCGALRAFNIYALIASASGTRPGTPSPFGPQTIPLNLDTWSGLSLDFANTAVWTNSLWFLDAAGKSTASFNVPPALVGWPDTLHHAVVTLDGNLASTFVTEPVAVRLY
ncbi:MAG TPA: choice-of-anchor tandem repeat NxxGxxAF-containing protein [Planctomycetota bacterium]|nr:choice-of-anchor tandem repeat NxxGxxAF-containing protein [Planctomycetota bacterium]